MDFLSPSLWPRVRDAGRRRFRPAGFKSEEPRYIHSKEEEERRARVDPDRAAKARYATHQGFSLSLSLSGDEKESGSAAGHWWACAAKKNSGSYIYRHRIELHGYNTQSHFFFLFSFLYSPLVSTWG